MDAWQPGDLWVLRGVAGGVAEEARTRGFPSPSLGGFGFIVSTTNYSTKLLDCLIGNIIWAYSSDGKVRFGSQAEVYDSIISTAAMEREPVARC